MSCELDLKRTTDKNQTSTNFQLRNGCPTEILLCFIQLAKA